MKGRFDYIIRVSNSDGESTILKVNSDTRDDLTACAAAVQKAMPYLATVKICNRSMVDDYDKAEVLEIRDNELKIKL